MLKIEKDIPKITSIFQETAASMLPGDSVLFEQEADAGKLCRALLKAHGQGAFSMKTVEGGWRVWRDEREVKARKRKGD